MLLALARQGKALGFSQVESYPPDLAIVCIKTQTALRVDKTTGQGRSVINASNLSTPWQFVKIILKFF